MMYRTMLLLTAVLIGTMQAQPVQELTADNFSSVITQQGIVVVKFYTSWCNPCTRYKPIFAQVAENSSNRIHFAQVDAEQYSQLAQQVGVRSFPTTIVYRNGVKIKTLGGYQTAEQLRQAVDAL